MMEEDYEEFTENQQKILEKYVTNTHSHIFVLRNLPEVIKGALFSRYSRSSLGLRSLLLKEFVNNYEAGFSLTSDEGLTEELSIKKAQAFYDRILDGYGDDSIGELGGAHLAIENISMLATKTLEDCRIGGSPLEKSTRYIYFDQKIQGEDYQFYHEPILMASAYRESYINTCNHLFDTYSRLIPPLTQIIEKTFPKDENISKAAYLAALRAKVLDCLRGLLPAGTLTNMGIFGNGRFFEQMLHKLHCHNLAELQGIGRRSYEELSKVIPSFVRRADPFHRTHMAYTQYEDALRKEIKLVTQQITPYVERSQEAGVRLLSWDSDAVNKVTAALLFAYSDKGLFELYDYTKQLPGEEIDRILNAACSARQNRRQKSPRALEHAFFTFEIVADFGAYRDMHRHRQLTQERQLLTCDYGYSTPKEILGTELEEPYRDALFQAKMVYDEIAKELPEEAQYVVPMAYNIRWYFHANLRALQWLCELRSSPAGHPNYRYIAQRMAKQVSEAVPAFERFFQFVDYEGYDLGRLDQEQRKAQRQQQLSLL